MSFLIACGLSWMLWSSAGWAAGSTSSQDLAPRPFSSYSFQAEMEAEFSSGTLQMELHEKNSFNLRLLRYSWDHYSKALLFASADNSVTLMDERFFCEDFSLDSFDFQSIAHDKASHSLFLFDMVWKKSAHPNAIFFRSLNISCEQNPCVHTFQSIWSLGGPLVVELNSSWVDHPSPSLQNNASVLYPTSFLIRPLTEDSLPFPSKIEVVFTQFSSNPLQDSDVLADPGWKCAGSERDLPILPSEFTYNVSKSVDSSDERYNVFYSDSKKLQRIKNSDGSWFRIYDYRNGLIFSYDDGVCGATKLKRRFEERPSTSRNITDFPSPWEHFSMERETVVLNSIYEEDGVNCTKYSKKDSANNVYFTWDFASRYQNQGESSYDSLWRMLKFNSGIKVDEEDLDIEFLPDYIPEGTFDLTNCSFGLDAMGFALRFSNLSSHVVFNEKMFYQYFRDFLESTLSISTVRIGHFIIPDDYGNGNITSFTVRFMVTDNRMRRFPRMALHGQSLKDIAYVIQKMSDENALKIPCPFPDCEGWLQGTRVVYEPLYPSDSSIFWIVMFIILCLMIIFASALGELCSTIKKYISNGFSLVTQRMRESYKFNPYRLLNSKRNNPYFNFGEL